MRFQSHFRTCSEGGKLSGPLVWARLTVLFSQCFRSAIHDRVHGVEIGKHPRSIPCSIDLYTLIIHVQWPGMSRQCWSTLEYIGEMGTTSLLSSNSYLISCACYWHWPGLLNQQIWHHCRQGVAFLPAALAKQFRQGKLWKSISSLLPSQ